MARVHELVTVRDEVSEGELQGIVSLANLLEEDASFEKDADRVLQSTFPSEALKRLLHRLGVALGERDADRKGNFLISGGYGSGKSHLLLCLYHILRNPTQALPWLESRGIDFAPPDDAEVILLPMNQLTKSDGSTVEYLWEPIFEALAFTGFRHTGNNYPTAEHIRKAVAGRRVFLIIDEIERWYLPIRDLHTQQANLGFLQNLTEFAQDATNGVILFMTLLMLGTPLQDIIDRVEVFPEDMTQAPDRRQIVLFRLVESIDEVGAAKVVDSYIRLYQDPNVGTHIDVGDLPAYRDRMLSCYPFHPAAIDTVFERYSGVAQMEEHSYSNSRGALYLLADVLRQALPGRQGSLEDVDLITTGDVSLDCRMFSDDLRQLNTALVDIATTCLAASESVDHASAVLSVVFLYSLGDPKQQRNIGATLGDLLLGVMRPQDAPGGAIGHDHVVRALRELEDTAVYLHQQENPARWLLKSEVNVQGKINRRARTEAVQKQVPDEILSAIHEAAGAHVIVYPQEEIPDVRDITVVLSTKHLEADEVIAEVYHGKSHPNGLVIVTPRDRGSLLDDGDLRNQAALAIAARQIAKEILGSGQPVPKLVQDKTVARGLIDAIPQRYGRWLAPFVNPDTRDLAFRPHDVSLATLLETVEERYDDSQYEGRVRDALQNAGDTPPTIQDVRDAFYKQRSYPKPIAKGRHSVARIDGAIQRLVYKAELKIIKGGDAHIVCGQDPGDFSAHARVWRVAIAREEDKPQFEVRKAILDAVRSQGERGLSVADIRRTCIEKAEDYSGPPPDDTAIDLVLIDLITTHQVLAPAIREPSAPLKSEAVVRWPGGSAPPDQWAELKFGGKSAAQVKTSAIKDIAKTDKLRDVSVRLVLEASGEAAGQLSGKLGIGSHGLGKESSARVAIELGALDVRTRDGLVEVLDGLPTADVIDLTVQLQRQGTPQGGGGQ